MSIDITLKQAEKLIECFGGDEETPLTLVVGNERCHAGKGLYVHDDYPEHGLTFLGEGGE